MFKLISLLASNWRKIAGAGLIVFGIYALVSVFKVDPNVRDWGAWLDKNGDSQLKNQYAKLQDDRARTAFIASCKTYEKRYGGGAWLRHFREDNSLSDAITYGDIAEIAVGISTVEERNAFLDEHAALYDACVRAGMLEEASKYGCLLKEVAQKGGKDWRVIKKNAFALAVYAATREHVELWSWYLDNYEWCDSFLSTCNPRPNDDEAELVVVLEFTRGHQKLLQRFNQELSSLTEDELKNIGTDKEDVASTRESLYAACLTFVGTYADVLEVIHESGKNISLLETMSVIANNCNAFNFDTREDRRTAGQELLALYEQHRILWDFATEDCGLDVVKFHRAVPAYSEQLIGAFGRMGVIPFLYQNYNDSDRLLQTASDVIYRCAEPGWAVLEKFHDNRQFKELMQNDRVGWRVVPYYLKKGDETFSELGDDVRWIDEMLDKDGNQKRRDVIFAEALPFIGDTVTVVRKWSTGRPVSASELGWAAFDVADMAMMAFTFGASKAATTTVKAGGKAAAKRIGRNATKSLTKTGMRRIEQGAAARLVSDAVVRGGRNELRDAFIKNGGRQVERKGISFLRRSAGFFKKPVELADDAFRKFRKLPPGTKKAIYKGAYAVGWFKFFGHTLPDKGPDAGRNLLEDVGATLGELTNAVCAGAGDGFKAALRETLGLSKSGEGLLSQMLFWMAGGLSILVGLGLIFHRRSPAAAAVR